VTPVRFDAVRAAAHHAAMRQTLERSTLGQFTFVDLERVESGRRTLRRVQVTERSTGRRTEVLTVSEELFGAAISAQECDLDDLRGELPAAAVVVDGVDQLLLDDRRAVQTQQRQDRQDTLISAIVGVDSEALGGTAGRVRAWAGGYSRMLQDLCATAPLSDGLAGETLSLEGDHRVRHAAEVGLHRLAELADVAVDLEALLDRVEALRGLGLRVDVEPLQVVVLRALSANHAASGELLRRAQTVLSLDLMVDGEGP
ncbi:MAG: hypothetical protein ACI9MC_002821, partial [Kiritimatiellia bacterium]